MRYSIDHPEIQEAFGDLRRLLSGLGSLVEKVELFGSTLTIPVREARDIDFFVGFRNATFDDVRRRLLANSLPRNVVVESVEGFYTNHPKWNTTRPLTLHIILYRDGVSEFSEKLVRTRQAAVDVTSVVLASEPGG